MFKNFFVNPIEQQNCKNQKVPSYIKEDGTKVYEQDAPVGRVVYEVSPDNVFISRTYNHSGQLIMEYARDRNLEIGRQYDEFDRIAFQVNIVYDEHNVQAMRKEYSYTYHDNGQKKTESVTQFPEDVTKVSMFNEQGKLTASYEQRGTVKIWFDADGKPVKREIDRGSGGIITEDLTKK